MDFKAFVSLQAKINAAKSFEWMDLHDLWDCAILKRVFLSEADPGNPSVEPRGTFPYSNERFRVDREGQRIECLSQISRLPNLQDELAQATQNFSKRFGRSQFLVAGTAPGCLREIKNRQKFRGVQNFAKF